MGWGARPTCLTFAIINRDHLRWRQQHLSHSHVLGSHMSSQLWSRWSSLSLSLFCPKFKRGSKHWPILKLPIVRATRKCPCSKWDIKWGMVLQKKNYIDKSRNAWMPMIGLGPTKLELKPCLLRSGKFPSQCHLVPLLSLPKCHF